MIKFNDFTREPEELQEAERSAIARSLKSGHYILGEEVKKFEKNWAETCGVQEAVGVANGMDAIEIILRALNIGANDEVIVPAVTAFATVLAVIRAGAKPVLVDIELDTALLSMEETRKYISGKTKAVILVHLYGRIEPMKNWQSLCQEYNVFLIEDCAQSHLAELDGVHGGSFGIAGAYSFYPTKNLGCKGDGGALVTDDRELAAKARYLRHYGQTELYRHDYLGLNSRLDELQAAILSARLPWLRKFTERRQEIANRYREEIKNGYITLLREETERKSHVQHLFVIRSKMRDALKKYLQENNIQTLIHYPYPINEQKAMAYYLSGREELRNSEEFCRTCLSLPCHPQLEDEELDRVISVVNNFRG
jgi:dTDP-4-amino-4,6-dideoxygalactose transaminase